MNKKSRKAVKEKMSEDDKEYLLELVRDHDIGSREDVELFETIFTQHDKTFIDFKKHRCSWWTLLIGTEKNKDDRYRDMIERNEKLVCERIVKRVAKLKN